MERLRERLEARTRELVDRLVIEHGLEGRSTLTLIEQMESFAVVGDEWLTPGRGAVIGGAVSGAVGGLAADVGLGGLTFGGGAVLGAILGALGGAGLAAGYRLAQGADEPAVSWSGPFLGRLCGDTVLRYLAVAHFGRGRGGYADTELSPRWTALVTDELAERGATSCPTRGPWPPRRAADRPRWWRRWSRPVRGDGGVLARGYPDAAPWLDGARRRRRSWRDRASVPVELGTGERGVGGDGEGGRHVGPSLHARWAAQIARGARVRHRRHLAPAETPPRPPLQPRSFGARLLRRTWCNRSRLDRRPSCRSPRRRCSSGRFSCS